ncbi:MAG: phosphotransferase [Ktedonobacteraceae bacterium]
MASPALFSYRAMGIILHPQGNRILLVSEQEGWSLPHIGWEATQYSHWSDVTLLNREMRRQLGGELTTMRCLSNTYNGETRCFSRVYVMELHSSDLTTLAPTQWIDIEDLTHMSMLSPDHRSHIEQWLADWSTLSSKTQRVPWYHPGWFARVVAWTEQQIAQLGERIIDTPEQLRVGERGYLLRVKTTEETFYLKALPPFFAHEIALLAYLALAYPTSVPALVAVDTDTQWMLMRDFGDALLSQSENLDDAEEALRRYAAIQIDQVEYIERLHALGCQYLPTETLAQQLDILLADTPSLTTNSPLSLSAEDMLRLHSLTPLLRSMCQQLTEAPIPASLEHGDFYDENIALTGAGPLFFDWTDSCIAHPFFSLYPFLLGAETKWSAIAHSRQRLRDAYLQPWERYAAKEQLVAIFELAQKLAPLYLACLYSSLIIPKMEAKWEMQHGVPYNLQALLERMRDEIVSS